MALRAVLVLAVLGLLVPGCLRVRPAPSAVVAPSAVPTLPPAAALPITELGLAPEVPRPTPSPTPALRRYTVQAGDSLWQIAERVGVSAQEIARANRLDDADRLAVGDTLLIPARPPTPPPTESRAARPLEPTPAPSRRHTVQAGDSLWSIAERFGLSAQEIARANRLDDPDRLAVGDTLVIPAGPPTAPAPESRAAPPPAATPLLSGRYTVREGDSLWSIAERFGVSVETLRAANRDASPESLRVGQTLAIPVTATPPGRR